MQKDCDWQHSTQLEHFKSLAIAKHTISFLSSHNIWTRMDKKAESTHDNHQPLTAAFQATMPT